MLGATARPRPNCAKVARAAAANDASIAPKVLHAEDPEFSLRRCCGRSFGCSASDCALRRRCRSLRCLYRPMISTGVDQGTRERLTTSSPLSIFGVLLVTADWSRVIQDHGGRAPRRAAVFVLRVEVILPPTTRLGLVPTRGRGPGGSGPDDHRHRRAGLVPAERLSRRPPVITFRDPPRRCSSGLADGVGRYAVLPVPGVAAPDLPQEVQRTLIPRPASGKLAQSTPD